MKTLRFLIAFVILALWSGSAVAQTTIDSTTFSSAVSPTATVVTLGSITCTGCAFGPGITLWANTEQMIVSGAWVSGATNIPVIRQRAAAHVSGATVFLGPATRFQKADPPIGACNKTLQGNGYYPWLNLVTGAEWLCDNGSATAYTAVLWRVLYPYAIGTQAASR